MSAVVARDAPLVVLAVGGDTDVAPHVGDALRSAGGRGRRVVLDDRSAEAALRAVDALRDLLPESPALPRARQAWRVATSASAWGRAASGRE